MYLYVVIFIILVPPSNISLRITPTHNVTAGTEVTILCTTDVSNPVQEIYWTKNGTVVSDTISTTLSGDFNAQYTTSELIIMSDTDLSGTQYGCQVGTLREFITLYVTCKFFLNFPL